LARKKNKNKATELSVFKGREAKLNRAIFQSLSLKSPQSIYEIHKNVRTINGLRKVHYGNVNKRVRALKESAYLRIVSIQNTKAGFEASLYELTNKACFAMILNLTNIDEFLSRIDEETALEILTIFLRTLI